MLTLRPTDDVEFTVTTDDGRPGIALPRVGFWLRSGGSSTGSSMATIDLRHNRRQIRNDRRNSAWRGQ